MPVSGEFLIISSRVPSEGAPPPLRPPPRSPFRKRSSIPTAPSSSLKVPGRPALLQVPQTGPLWKEIAVSGTFSIYPSGSPARALLPGSLHRALKERERERQTDTPHPEPLSTISQSPQ